MIKKIGYIFIWVFILSCCNVKKYSINKRLLNNEEKIEKIEFEFSLFEVTNDSLLLMLENGLKHSDSLLGVNYMDFEKRNQNPSMIHARLVEKNNERYIYFSVCEGVSHLEGLEHLHSVDRGVKGVLYYNNVLVKIYYETNSQVNIHDFYLKDTNKHINVKMDIKIPAEMYSKRYFFDYKTVNNCFVFDGVYPNIGTVLKPQQRLLFQGR